MFMANKTPIFSFLFMVSFQMIFHGKIARMISIAAEYAARVMV